MGRMICTKKARDNCEYSRLCGENAEVADDSECADYIMEMEVLTYAKASGEADGGGDQSGAL